MLAHATLDKLSALRLPALADAFQRQLGNPEFTELTFEDRVGLLVDAEWTHREQRKLRRRLRQANLRRHAALEDIDWHSPRRGLDKALVHSLATCAWIAQHRNLLVIGPTGIGKSWLGEAFAERACRSGYAAYCVRASRLFHELHVARGDGSYTRTLARLAKLDLLVIDDCGPRRPHERRAPRSARGPRGSQRTHVDLDHQPGAGPGVARAHRRAHARRRDLRSAHSHRVHHRAPGAVASRDPRQGGGAR